MTIHQDVYDLAKVSIALRVLRGINPLDSSVIAVEWHDDVIEMLESWEEQLQKHVKKQGVIVP